MWSKLTELWFFTRSLLNLQNALETAKTHFLTKFKYQLLLKYLRYQQINLQGLLGFYKEQIKKVSWHSETMGFRPDEVWDLDKLIWIGQQVILLCRCDETSSESPRAGSRSGLSVSGRGGVARPATADTRCELVTRLRLARPAVQYTAECRMRARRGPGRRGQSNH